ncbi:MAG: branched-chain amino acid transferase [Alphaproteobacteria bacterium]|nr:branched-chain amino acid transferase [Alphaproteobacteria bacterium]
MASALSVHAPPRHLTDSAAGVAFVGGAFCPISEARLSLLDWGFLRNDATHDVVTTWHGTFFRLDDHIARFERSVAGLRMTMLYRAEEVREILLSLVRLTGLRDAYVQMIMTRGRPPIGSRDPRQAENQFFAHAIPYVWIAPPEKQEQGLNIAISRIQRIPEESVNPVYKNFSWMDLQQALLEAYDRGAETVVLPDRDGNLTEGPGFNIFAVKGGTVTTPARGVLEGITRKTVFELCAETNVRWALGAVPAAALGGMDEVFISSSAGGIMPITRLEGRPIGDGLPGPLTRRLTKLYWQKREAGWHGTPVDYFD